MIEFDLEVDASGLNCPLPLLRLKKGLMEVSAGEVIKIIATDPAAHLDIGVYIEQTGHKIIKFLNNPEKQVFYIKKKFANAEN
ncbi:MAG: sulfurtransferase TusA family protein [Methylococcales bacterium]|nr:sulfurtransferase TusA family protein [Methylococcales bacterium]